jgi:hypothetical protein
MINPDLITRFEKREPSWWRNVMLPCAICKKAYEIDKGFGVVSPRRESMGYVCSEECYNMFILRNI